MSSTRLTVSQSLRILAVAKWVYVNKSAPQVYLSSPVGIGPRLLFASCISRRTQEARWNKEPDTWWCAEELRLSGRSSPATLRHFRGRLVPFLFKSFFNALSWSANAESRPKGQIQPDSAYFLSNMEPHESFPAVCQVKLLKQATFLKQNFWLPQSSIVVIESSLHSVMFSLKHDGRVNSCAVILWIKCYYSD